MLRVATFNAGLAVGVLPYATERVPHVVQALAELEVDVLFVQEFWLDAHFDALVAATRDQLPYVFRPAPTQPVARGGCTREELEPLVACARKHCSGLQSDELGACVIRHCAATAMSMSGACLSCITAHPIGTLDEIVSPCIGAAPANDVGHVAYGGSFGTGLLSRHPLRDAEQIVFEATLNARGALRANVDNVYIHAVHFSPGMHGEQAAQVEAFLEFVGDREPAVILGDLNMSPGSSLYRRFEKAGFHNPYRGPGTYSHSALTGARHGDGWPIDHVLLRGLRAARAERILDQPLKLASGARTAYSDHCGVLVEIKT